MTKNVGEPPQPPHAWAVWAAVCVGFLQAAAGLAIVAFTREDVFTGCEGDGHFLRAAYLRCGDLPRFWQSGSASWPWVYPWATALLSPLVGTPYLAGRLVSVAAMATLTTTVFWAAWRQWRSIGTAAVAAVVIGTTPQLLYYGTLVSTDLLAVAMTSLALPCVLGALRGEALGANGLGIGVTGALASQTRYQMLPLVVITVAALVWGLPAGRRLRVTVAAAAGFTGTLLVCAALPWSTPDGWAGLCTAWRAAGQPPAGAPAQVLARYAHSAGLLAWHVDYLPLLGLVALADRGLDHLRRRREGLVLLAPVFAQFVAVGWFPDPSSVELRRLFLPALPVCALGCAAAWRRLRAWEGPRAMVTAPLVWAFVLLTVNQGFAEFPVRSLFPWGVPWPGIGYDSPQRRWDFDHIEGTDPPHPKLQATLLDLHTFTREHDLGCSVAVTNSVTASLALPSPVLCRPGVPPCSEARGLDNTALSELVRTTRSVFGVRWVLEAPHRDHYALDPSQPVDARGELRLVARPAPSGFRLYEIVHVTPP